MFMSVYEDFLSPLSDHVGFVSPLNVHVGLGGFCVSSFHVGLGEIFRFL